MLTIRSSNLPSTDKEYLKDWIRGEFKSRKDKTDTTVIEMLLTQGRMQLRELKTTLELATN